MIALQTVTFAQPLVAARSLVLYVIVSAAIAGAVAAIYRWYVSETAPSGVTTIAGVGAVALYLNTASLGTVVIADGPSPFQADAVVFNLVALGVATVAAPIGARVGDRAATDVFAVAKGRRIEGEVGRLTRSVGRVTPVTLPEEIEDIPDYDPVKTTIKAEMAGKTLLFPHGLTVPELRDRLVTRLKEDYGVTHVDVELDEEATVDRLAVGRRVAGLGPTLAPGSAAVAVTADPAFSATPGDVVQVWQPATAESDPTRLVTAELRSRAGNVATLSIDESEAESLDASTTYRLVTLPTAARADREFVAALRGADETMSVVTITPGSPLEGQPVRDVGATVVGIKSEAGRIEAMPAKDRSLSGGDLVYLLARPETLRRLEEAAATVDDPSVDAGDDASDRGQTQSS